MMTLLYLSFPILKLLATVLCRVYFLRGGIEQHHLAIYVDRENSLRLPVVDHPYH